VLTLATSKHNTPTKILVHLLRPNIAPHLYRHSLFCCCHYCLFAFWMEAQDFDLHIRRHADIPRKRNHRETHHHPLKTFALQCDGSKDGSGAEE